MSINTSAAIETFMAAVKQHAVGPIKQQGASNLADLGWNALRNFMDRYTFPLDQPYVNQSDMARIVQSVCTTYERPDITPLVQLFIYVAWREVFLNHPWQIYNNTQFPDEPRLHVACCHEDTCNQVAGYAYSSCTAQIGDALRLSDIAKPIVGNLSGEKKLDTLWKQLIDDDELPQGEIARMGILEDILNLLEFEAQHGKPMAISKGLSDLNASITHMADSAYQGDEPWKTFCPEDALLMICHSVILAATVGFSEEASL